jgi:coenzyme PQQ biosynthesis protein PqqD
LAVADSEKLEFLAGRVHALFGLATAGCCWPPERVFKADAIAAEILKRCSGEATVEAIVDDLAKIFTAPRERVHADVVKLIGTLADKKLLEL